MYDTPHGKADPGDFHPDGPTQRDRGSLLPVVVVVGFILAAVLLLVAFTGIAGLFIMLALGSVIGFVGLHYLLWGWWLSKSLRDDDAAKQGDDDRE